MLDELAVAVKEVAALEPATLTDAELGDIQVELQRQRQVLEAAQARLAAAFDLRRAHAADGDRSAPAWLARHTRLPRSECSRRVKLGRAEPVMPLVAAAWQAGEIAEAHVSRLFRARNLRTARAFARDEAMLLGFARELPFRQFDTAVTYWEHHADPDGADEAEMAKQARRRVDVARTLDGMVACTVLLDPVSGEIVASELRRLEQELFEGDWQQAKERLDRDPHSWELPRTPSQRRADALAMMAMRSATMPKGGKRPKPLFTLVLGAPALQRVCRLGSGQPVAPAAAVPWLDDADLERILFDGSPQRPLSVSYKRSFTGALRRLIEVRDEVCYFEGCDEPAEHAQIDHVQPWARGGVTAHWNGRPACGHHNRLRNRRQPPDDDEHA